MSSLLAPSVSGQNRRQDNKSGAFVFNPALDGIRDPHLAAFTKEITNLSKVIIAESIAIPNRKGIGNSVAGYLRERRKDGVKNDKIIELLVGKGSFNTGGKQVALRELYDPNNKAHAIDRLKPNLGRNKALSGLLTGALDGQKPKNKRDLKRIGTVTWGNLGYPGLSNGGSTGPSQPYTKLKYRLHRLVCEKQTRSERGKDEITLAGIAVAPNVSDPIPVNQHDAGDFNDRDAFSWQPPFVYHEYTLAGTNYPDMFVMTQVLAETDWGGLSGFMDDLYEETSSLVEVIISESAAAMALSSAVSSGAAIGSIAGPIGTIIGAAVGAIVAGIIIAINSVSRDDIFQPMILAVQVPFLNGQNPTAITTATFRDFGATYHLDHSWSLS